MIEALAFTMALALLGSEPAPPERTQIRGGGGERPSVVLDRARLDETAGGDLAAVLDSEPGLTVGRLGGLGAFSTLSIRGATPEQLVLVLDGIPLTPADGAPVDLSTLPVGPLRSVDVFRGRVPWSLGQDGLGGALVLHTRAAERGPALGVEAELGLGAFETAWLRGWVGVPRVLGSSGPPLSLSVALDALHSGSDYRFANDHGTAWTTADDTTDTRANADVDQLSALVRADLALDHWRLGLAWLATLGERGLPSLGVIPTVASRYALERHLAALHLAGEAGPLRLELTGYLAASDATVHDPRGEIGLGVGTTTTTSLVPGATLTVRWPLLLGALRVVPTVGASLRHEATHGDEIAASDRDVLAAWVELALRDKDLGLELAAGLRATADVASDGHGALGTYLEGAWTTDGLRLSLGARLAPRLPSLFELHGDTGLALGNPDLSPESAATLELGARWEPRLGDDRPLALSAFAYATWADDLIQAIQNAQGVTRPENLASARLLGLELAAEARWSLLHLRSGFTWLEAVDTSDVAARRGNHLPYRPRWSTSHRLELRWDDAALGPSRGALGLYVELDWVAGNHLDFANLVAVPARTVLGAGGFVRAERVEVTLSLANLTSDRVQDLAGYPLPGLTTMLALRFLEGSP